MHINENGRLAGSMAAVTAVSLLLSGLLCAATAVCAGRAAHDAVTGMIGTVAARYPDAEQAVVRNLQQPDGGAAALGRELLGRYGLSGAAFQGSAFTSSLLRFLLPADLIFTALVCAAFLCLLLSHRRRIDTELGRLTDYLQRVSAGDETLEIRDNREGAMSILKNEIYKITVTLREQAEALKKDRCFLTTSLADISHQIRTPLASLFVLADLLDQNPPEEKRCEFIGRLKAQLERISWLVSTLLKLSRLDAGTAELKHVRLTLRELVARAVEPLVIPAELRRVCLTADGGQGFVVCDPEWSAEALTNIVKNCVEHTSAGGAVTVTWSENALFCEIAVSDNGEGIAPEDLPHIFTRFYRGRNAGENSVGIGLAMARAVIEAQGGSVTAKSRPGEGSRFVLRMPKGII